MQLEKNLVSIRMNAVLSDLIKSNWGLGYLGFQKRPQRATLSI